MDEIESSLRVPVGEVLGSVLLGLAHAFRDAQIGPIKRLDRHIETNEWYPMSCFFTALEEARKINGDLGPLLFQAGAKFAENFYYHGGGMAIAPCATDFLRLHSKNGGYSLVHRGDPKQIGWQDLLELDEPEGKATVVCVTPYPVEFERGTMHRGTSIGGDVDFVHVESIEEPYNRYLKKKTHVITFKPKAPAKESA